MAYDTNRKGGAADACVATQRDRSPEGGSNGLLPVALVGEGLGVDGAVSMQVAFLGW